MSEIFLYGLHVVTVLQGEHSEGVAQIMHTGIRCSGHCCDFLMMGVEPLRVQMVAEGIGKDQAASCVLLGGVYPILPQVTGL